MFKFIRKPEYPSYEGWCHNWRIREDSAVILEINERGRVVGHFLGRKHEVEGAELFRRYLPTEKKYNRDPDICVKFQGLADRLPADMEVWTKVFDVASDEAKGEWREGRRKNIWSLTWVVVFLLGIYGFKTNQAMEWPFLLLMGFGGYSLLVISILGDGKERVGRRGLRLCIGGLVGLICGWVAWWLS